ncbi:MULTISPECIES: hypothetical protein [unclassified Microcoleus]|uniref:hypothetical protein n=1 Tax=unclassified Microcoleus TaxID=2642155 RepID=UPI002FD67618
MPLNNPITEAQIPPPIARDTETAAAIANHEAQTNPHPQYATTNSQEFSGGVLSTTGTAPTLSNPSANSRIGWGIASGNTPFLFFINKLAPVGAKIVDFILDQFGNFYVRKINDNYSPAGLIENIIHVSPQGNISLLKNLEINGFVKVGTTGIKIKTISGTTAGASNTYTSFPHDLNGGKIIFATAVVYYAANSAMPPNHPVAAAGCTFAVYCDASNLVIYLPPSTSANILNKNFIATIFYVE